MIYIYIKVDWTIKDDERICSRGFARAIIIANPTKKTALKKSVCR